MLSIIFKNLSKTSSQFNRHHSNPNSCRSKSTVLVLGLWILISSCNSSTNLGAQELEVKTSHVITSHAKRLVTFDHPDGIYTNSMLSRDFGNGSYSPTSNFASITDSVYRVTYKKGEKVHNTGAMAKIKIVSARQYTLEYDIKYPLDFESGLHGKQFGFHLGVGYGGGKGEEARTNGDGGSVRIQFDALDDSISNQLYVYYSGMKGKYGNNPGGFKYKMPRNKWNTIRLTVTLESTFEASDGRIEVWCNNVKKIDVKGLALVRENSHRFITGISFKSFPGGGGIFPTFENYLYVDNFRWRPGFDQSESTDLTTNYSSKHIIKPTITKGKLTISNSESIKRIKFFDLSGILLKEWKNEQQIDIGEFAKGIYFVQLIDKYNLVSSQRIIKQ